MGLKQKFCPDCKTVPVTFVPGKREEGNAPKDYYLCSNCETKFSVDFTGFIKRSIKPRKAFGATTYLADKENRKTYNAYWL